jgi:hypothetical protein
MHHNLQKPMTVIAGLEYYTCGAYFGSFILQQDVAVASCDPLGGDARHALPGLLPSPCDAGTLNNAGSATH